MKKTPPFLFLDFCLFSCFKDELEKWTTTTTKKAEFNFRFSALPTTLTQYKCRLWGWRESQRAVLCLPLCLSNLRCFNPSPEPLFLFSQSSFFFFLFLLFLPGFLFHPSFLTYKLKHAESQKRSTRLLSAKTRKQTSNKSTHTYTHIHIYVYMHHR